MKLNVKKISGFLSVLVLSLSLFSVPVMASETNRVVFSGSVEVKPDTDKSSGNSVLKAEDSDGLGSISVQLEEMKDKNPRGKVKLAVVKVADVTEGEFVLTSGFENSGVDLNAIQNANELEIAAAELAKIAGKDNIIVTDDNGLAVASDLEVGVYLIYATDIAEYDDILPFLISIPTWSEETEDMIYDVIAYPKHGTVDTTTGNQAPGTGVENHAFEYLGISIACVIGACIVFLAFGKKNKN